MRQVSLIAAAAAGSLFVSPSLTPAAVRQVDSFDVGSNIWTFSGTGGGGSSAFPSGYNDADVMGGRREVGGGMLGTTDGLDATASAVANFPNPGEPFGELVFASSANAQAYFLVRYGDAGATGYNFDLTPYTHLAIEIVEASFDEASASIGVQGLSNNSFPSAEIASGSIAKGFTGTLLIPLDFSAPQLNPADLDWLSFTIDGPSNDDIGLTDATLRLGSIHLVPEPATLALLTFGALALLRRQTP